MKKIVTQLWAWISARYAAAMGVINPTSAVDLIYNKAVDHAYDQALWDQLLLDLSSPELGRRMNAAKMIADPTFAPGFRKRHPKRVAKAEQIVRSEIFQASQNAKMDAERQARENELIRLFR